MTYTKKCPFCQEEIVIDATSCVFCGENLENKCPFCGENIKDGVIKCQFCGNYLLDEKAISRLKKEIQKEAKNKQKEACKKQQEALDKPIGEPSALRKFLLFDTHRHINGWKSFVKFLIFLTIVFILIAIFDK